MLPPQAANEPRKYGLVWDESVDIEDVRCVVLERIPDRDIITDPAKPVNLLIEGENYHALTALNRTHLGAVDVIYIDPPYNTGSRDFRYNDRYVDKNDPFRHSKWLSFMARRLRLARELLKPTGFICVSIDDHEIAPLRLLMDAIFGEDNYRNTIVTRRHDKNLNRQFMARGLTSLNIGVEYVLVYARSPEARMNPVFRAAPEGRRKRGYWKGFWNAADRPTMRYPLLGVTPDSGQWKWKESVALEAVRNYEEYLAHYADQMTLEEYWERTGRVKRFVWRFPNGRGKNQGVCHWVPPSDGILRNSNWTDLLTTGSIRDMGLAFDKPKNIRLITELLKLCGGPDAVVLDFFAGSGTTGHAVLELNRQDGGTRQFILVTNNENSICTEVAYPRLFKAITGYTTPTGKRAAGLGGNLAYLRVSVSDHSDANAILPSFA